MLTPFMESPKVMKSFEIKSGASQQSNYCGRWIPSRPTGIWGLRLWHRTKLAFHVFRGRYDALDWHETETCNAEGFDQ